MSVVADLHPMALPEAEAFLEAKGFTTDMQTDALAALARSLSRHDLMTMRRALLTVGNAHLHRARAEISAAATVQRILRL